jgi:C4-dicarboxylate-specific signal transduction histidine kinase
VVVVDDVTERAALERTSRQSEKLAALGTLSAGIAHELNNPIGIMCSRIELMLLDGESNGLPAGAQEDLKVVQRHAQRVARIAQGLLSFARQAPFAHGRVDLNALVGETLMLMEGELAQRQIEVRRRLTTGLAPVWGDVNALQQVLVNLLTNARDAVADGGVITVETDTPPGRPDAARLIVRDTGPGIPPEVSARVFDPFFTTKPAGTGLGLSVSYGIVRDHKGTLDVESRPGAGATFIATFPTADTGVPA